MTSGTSRERLDAAFEASPRPWFLPADVRERWSEDRPLQLAHGMTNSQPSTVLEMLRLLDVPIGARVLDVGSGSGWTTALLAHLVGSTGSVLGLEIEPELVAFGRRNLGVCERDWAAIEDATPGVLGRPEAAPYDRILVSAMATELPGSLVAQLAPAGIMVVPVAGRMVRVTAADEPIIERFGRFRFVPLR
ncbi:MAG: protein-L-isoaspartate O-methyltransferase [Micrococcales bacterium]|nr:protein-L-isoaspartate O-methyltransferase [Micrococcales bacterium]